MLWATFTNFFKIQFKKFQIAMLMLVVLLPLNCHSDEKKESSSSDASDSSTSTAKGPSNSRLFFYGAYGFYSGVSTSSFAGQSEIVGGVSIERKSGFFRLFAGGQIDVMSSGSLTLGTATTASIVKYSAIKLQTGARIFPMASNIKAGFDPFVSLGASYSRGGVNVTPSTTELETFFRPNLYGYEISLGFDIKSSNPNTPVLRPRIAYSVEQGKFSNLTNFMLNRVEFHLGIGF